MPEAHQICPEFLHQLDSFQIRLVPGPKLQAASQATSYKPQAMQGSSSKLQAASFKQGSRFKKASSTKLLKVQAASFKPQAASIKLQATSC
jgi:hypothetical protein